MNPEPHIKNRLRIIFAYLHEPEYMRALADIYWRILLSIASIVILCAVGYGALSLMGALSDTSGSLTPVVGKDSPTLTQAELQTTLDALNTRRARYESLKTNPPAVADPSR